MTSRTRIVENKWGCSQCQAKNLGRHTKCQNCGAQKGKDVQDEVPQPNAAPTVTDPELLRLANQKANWACEYCGGQTRDERGKCENCAAGKEVPKATSSPTGTSSVPSSSRPSPPPSRPPPAPPRPSAASPKSKFSPQWLLLLLVPIAVAGFIFGLSPYEEDVECNRINWVYSSVLREKVLKHDNGWGRPLLVTPITISCTSKYYGQEDCNPYQCNPRQESYQCNCTSYQCNCHESCSNNGNGFSTCRTTCSTCQRCSTCSRTVYSTCYRKCDVYKDWCEYDYYDWPIKQALTTNGVSHEVFWPALVAEGPDQRLERTEKYAVEFKRNTKGSPTWTYEPKTLDDFKRFDPGAKWRIEVRRISSSAKPLQELK